MIIGEFYSHSNHELSNDINKYKVLKCRLTVYSIDLYLFCLFDVDSWMFFCFVIFLWIFLKLNCRPRLEFVKFSNRQHWFLSFCSVIINFWGFSNLVSKIWWRRSKWASQIFKSKFFYNTQYFSENSFVAAIQRLSNSQSS